MTNEHSEIDPYGEEIWNDEVFHDENHHGCIEEKNYYEQTYNWVNVYDESGTSGSCGEYPDKNFKYSYKKKNNYKSPIINRLKKCIRNF